MHPARRWVGNPCAVAEPMLATLNNWERQVARLQLRWSRSCGDCWELDLDRAGDQDLGPFRSGRMICLSGDEAEGHLDLCLISVRPVGAYWRVSAVRCPPPMLQPLQRGMPQHSRGQEVITASTEAFKVGENAGWGERWIHWTGEAYRTAFAATTLWERARRWVEAWEAYARKPFGIYPTDDGGWLATRPCQEKIVPEINPPIATLVQRWREVAGPCGTRDGCDEVFDRASLAWLRRQAFFLSAPPEGMEGAIVTRITGAIDGGHLRLVRTWEMPPVPLVMSESAAGTMGVAFVEKSEIQAPDGESGLFAQLSVDLDLGLDWDHFLARVLTPRAGDSDAWGVHWPLRPKARVLVAFPSLFQWPVILGEIRADQGPGNMAGISLPSDLPLRLSRPGGIVLRGQVTLEE